MSETQIGRIEQLENHVDWVISEVERLHGVIEQVELERDEWAVRARCFERELSRIPTLTDAAWHLLLEAEAGEATDGSIVSLRNALERFPA